MTDCSMKKGPIKINCGVVDLEEQDFEQLGGGKCP
jgi:hypothetical protein